MYSIAIKPITAIIIATVFFLAMLFSYSQQATYAARTCAQGDPPSCQACTGAGGDWTVAGCTDASANPVTLTGTDESVLEQVIEILTFLVGAISVIMLIVGGLRYVLSSGDANSTAAAKNTILYAIVGVVIAFAARAIVFFVLGRL